jgi:hypothetical protein
VNHPRGLRCQRLQQLLVLGAERLRTVGVHVEHPAHLARDFEGHGQFRADLAPEHHVARVARHVAHARRLARARHPAGDALADPQLELGRIGRQALGGVNLQEAVGGIDQHDRPAGCAH